MSFDFICRRLHPAAIMWRVQIFEKFVPDSFALVATFGDGGTIHTRRNEYGPC